MPFKRGHTPWNKGLTKETHPSLQVVSRKMTGNKSHTGKKFSKEWRRKISESRMGSKNPVWRGGRRKCGKGYVLILKPDHPNTTKSGYVREHRLVVEKNIGRLLRKDEVVHHKNGIIDDNRLENLELMSKSKHDSNTWITYWKKKKGRKL